MTPVRSEKQKAQERAIADFFVNERFRLVRYVRRRVNDLSEMDAEDILQDLLVNLFEKTDLSLQIEHLAAYIYRSLSNRVIDWLRKRKPVPSSDSLEKFGDEELMCRVNRGEFDLTGLIERKEFREHLLAALDSLEPRQRAVWIATEIEGYTFRELAEIWNEPMGSLLSRKHRATKALQRLLGEFKDNG